MWTIFWVMVVLYGASYTIQEYENWKNQKGE